MRSSTLPWTELGRVDVLVNNAAGNFVVRAEDLSPNGWRAVVSIVLDGGFLCTRAAAKKMMEHGERRRDPERPRELCVDRRPGDGPLRRGQGGTLGDDEDVGGRVGAAQDQSEHDHSRSDRYRGRRRSALADRRGSGSRRATVPAGRLATVEEIAWWTTALCSRYADYITGENLTIDGGHWLEQEGYLPALGEA